MRNDSPALPAENTRFPIKHIRILDLFDGTSERPQEHPHKSRMTLMSPTECEIVRCIPNQLEMMPNSPVLGLEQSPVPHHTREGACPTLGNARDSLRHPSQIQRNTKFSTGPRGKLHGRHIFSRREQIARILLKR